MNLENAVKFFSPKSTSISDSSSSTSPDRLTSSDIMMGFGFAQSRAPLGYSAFMGKVGVSDNDARRAVSLLTEYALSTCDKVAALRKLDTDIKPAVMQTLATYAYMDYCRSAASVKPCECCQAKGFIEADVFTMKSPLSGGSARSVKEVVRVICKTCRGKGVVSSSCRDCSGRGRAVDRKLTEEQGVPVLGDCKQCGGRGFERTPSTDAYRAIACLTDAVSLATWEKSGKAFYEQLIGKLEIEESWANAALNQVTR